MHKEVNGGYCFIHVDAYGDTMIQIKRVYEASSNEDGFRILVDRLWPRGLSKEKAKVDLWLKEIAPSEGLRKWFAHETGKWDEFCKRYWMELEQKKDLIALGSRGRLYLWPSGRG